MYWALGGTALGLLSLLPSYGSEQGKDALGNRTALGPLEKRKKNRELACLQK